VSGRYLWFSVRMRLTKRRRTRLRQWRLGYHTDQRHWMKSCVNLQMAVAVVAPLCRFVGWISSEGRLDSLPRCLDRRKVGGRTRHRPSRLSCNLKIQRSKCGWYTDVAKTEQPLSSAGTRWRGSGGCVLVLKRRSWGWGRRSSPGRKSSSSPTVRYSSRLSQGNPLTLGAVICSTSSNCMWRTSLFVVEQRAGAIAGQDQIARPEFRSCPIHPNDRQGKRNIPREVLY